LEVKGSYLFDLRQAVASCRLSYSVLVSAGLGSAPSPNLRPTSPTSLRLR
jgi:hypothetical protein